MIKTFYEASMWHLYGLGFRGFLARDAEGFYSGFQV